MEKLSHMIDMARTPEEAKESAEKQGFPTDSPVYPYGLAISLGEEELEKLGVDYSDWSVGDLFHLHAMTKITSISEREMENGNCCRVEMQIIALTGESEDDENREEEKDEPVGNYGHL